MKKTAVIAVSVFAMGMTQVACMSAGNMSRANAASARPAKPGQQSETYIGLAAAAAQRGSLQDAIVFAEQAVSLSPRDSGYRFFLGNLYLRSGRFQSAQTSFADVVALDPANGRAALNLALSDIALGRKAHALNILDSLSSTAAPSDLGLAYALAGQPQRGIAMLEPAARASDANARVRQNLALAYALAGDWRNAQAIAAQDVSPAELATRMRQWASFTQPAASWDQVAHLLGVTPVADEGQPVRLALGSSRPADTALAAAEPAPEPAPQVSPAQAVEAAPVILASAEPEAPAPAGEWGRTPRPAQPEEVAQPVYAEAVQALVAPNPRLVRASIDTATAPVIPFQPRARFTSPPSSGGRYVVQLGAFGTAKAVEHAWAQAYRRYGFASRTPLSTTIQVAGRGIFHRLSVSGFDSRSAADSACRSVRAKGGACFVRTVAGDAPVRWASRYTNRPA
jgi:Flp pilus assembly protein TadD